MNTNLVPDDELEDSLFEEELEGQEEQVEDLGGLEEQQHDVGEEVFLVSTFAL